MLKLTLNLWIKTVVLMILFLSQAHGAHSCKSILSKSLDPLKDDFVKSFLFQNMRFPLSPFPLNMDLSLLHLLQGKSRSHDVTVDDLYGAFSVMRRVHEHSGVRTVSYRELQDVFLSYVFEVPFRMFDALEVIGDEVYKQSLIVADDNTAQLSIAVPPGHEILHIARKIRELLRDPEVTKLSLAHKKELLKGDFSSNGVKNASLEALRAFIVPRLILDFPHLDDKIWDGEISKADMIFYGFSGLILTGDDEPGSQTPPPNTH